MAVGSFGNFVFCLYVYGTATSVDELAVSWSKSVFSEMIAEVGWDDQTEELLVTFIKKGRTAAYKGFDEGMADRLSKAASVGGMFNSEIKPFASSWRYV